MKPAVLVVTLLAVACGPEHRTYAQWGEALSRDPNLANSSFNHFSCTTCHVDRATAAGAAVLPGAALAGVTQRPSWWGGTVLDLHAAMDVCLTRFMRGPALPPESNEAQALLAWMTERSQAAPVELQRAQPFSVPGAVSDLVLGVSERGRAVYSHACQSCHGDLHSGAGRLAGAVILPEATLQEHLPTFGPACTRVVFIEKVRHGSFLGLAGVMPPFSMEVLGDDALADLLAYLEVPTGGQCP